MKEGSREGFLLLKKFFNKKEKGAMKKLAVVFAALILVLTGSIAYAGQFGPPEPAAKEGKAALGIGYFHYSAKLKPKDTTNFAEHKSEQNQSYLQLGYGFVKNAEVYIRVGGADLKIKDAFDTDSPRAGYKSDFKDGYKPFGTIGAKGVFNVSPSFGIGPFIQASFYSGYKDSTSGTNSGFQETQEVKLKNMWEANLGLGLQVKMGETIIYGGPVAYLSKVKDEYTSKVVGATYVATGTDTLALSTSYKEKNNVGGFAGVRVPLSKSLSLEVEGQYKSEFSIGGSLTYAF